MSGSYVRLPQPAVLRRLLSRPGGCGRAAAPGCSQRGALSFWRSWAPVGSGAAGRRTRRSAESNRWSGYPITSLSTSVRQKDMARRGITWCHLINAMTVFTAGERNGQRARARVLARIPAPKSTSLSGSHAKDELQTRRRNRQRSEDVTRVPGITFAQVARARGTMPRRRVPLILALRRSVCV